MMVDKNDPIFDLANELCEGLGLTTVQRVALINFLGIRIKKISCSYSIAGHEFKYSKNTMLDIKVYNRERCSLKMASTAFPLMEYQEYVAPGNGDHVGELSLYVLSGRKK